MERTLEALQLERDKLLSSIHDPIDVGAATEWREHMFTHVQHLHGLLQEMQLKVEGLEAESVALRSLPPPPPIGMEEITAQQNALEDLQAKDEVLRRQLGALIHDKGQLNLQLQQRDRDLQRLAEEKASLVSALTAALKRVAAERDAIPSTARNGSAAHAMHAEQMIASQKRTIESLRRELHERRRSQAEASGEADRVSSASSSLNASRRDSLQPSVVEQGLRNELETVREQMAMATLQYRSDRASMATQLAVLRSQVSITTTTTTTPLPPLPPPLPIIAAI